MPEREVDDYLVIAWRDGTAPDVGTVAARDQVEAELNDAADASLIVQYLGGTMPTGIILTTPTWCITNDAAELDAKGYPTHDCPDCWQGYIDAHAHVAAGRWVAVARLHYTEVRP